REPFWPISGSKANASNHERESNQMFGRSSLAKVLDKWAKHGGDLDEFLSSGSDQPVHSKADAIAICAALDAIRAEPKRAGKQVIGSPLHTLAAFFQQVETKEALEVLRQDGLPRLRTWVRDLLDGRDVEEHDVMFIMKILAMYRQREDVDAIAQAARMPIDASGYMWSVILSQFNGEHPYAADMIEALRDPLPTQFILVAYLDMANGLAIAKKLDRHPFDSQAGRKHLEAWLRDTNEQNYSYAHSATAALPFIDPTRREDLLQAANGHPHSSVRMEAAWARAKSGDPAGVDRLSELCLDPRYSHTAQQYLEELGHSAKIPEEAQRPDFQAVAVMANWLSHPNEFGRPPDTIELCDTRELFWPPTNDRRQLSLVRYTYNDGEGGEPHHGVGMVGSITFALAGEATADLSPEATNGLHCCWELEVNGDSRAPKKRTAKAGHEILARHNDSF
ncbi:MAG: HEAT repeat domain-containing protein, partial [Planctomycetota bacterium]